MIKIRLLEAADISNVVANFKKNHWLKPTSTFEAYLKEQELGKRVVWIAFDQNEFAGYVTYILLIKL